MLLGLLNADMDPSYIITAAPVYSHIPVYTFDDDDGVWEDEHGSAPPLLVKSGKCGVMTVVVDPFAWLLYMIEEETEEDLIEFEMQDKEFSMDVKPTPDMD